MKLFFYFSPEQKKAIMAILQQTGSSTSHTINQVRTKPNESKQVRNKTSQQAEDDRGSSNALLPIYKASRWIIDTGAIDHVCHSLKRFQSINKIRPLSVKLPNGDYEKLPWLEPFFSPRTSISMMFYLFQHLILISLLFLN
jgi:hypothetical protein